jgi:UDP-glucose 4-epimerase
VSLLVVGRGLLGKGLLRTVSRDDVFPTGTIRWDEPRLARKQLSDLAEAFARDTDGPWRVAWCAGAGVVETSDAQFSDEQSFLEAFLESLRGSVQEEHAGNGRLFFASSAGGVYGAGSSHFLTEGSPESPVSAYGRSKVTQERLVVEWSTDTMVPALIGRISNLYGPGQNLSKPQGYISQLLRSMLVRQPFQLRSSGDTERDFIHVDDAAARIHAWLNSDGEVGVTRKLISSGRSHTLPRVANVARAVTRIQPKIMYAADTGSSPQPRHLRFTSHVRTDLDLAAPSRPLEVGVSQTWHAMLRGFSEGSLSRGGDCLDAALHDNPR